jgi:hypothetical protein
LLQRRAALGAHLLEARRDDEALGAFAFGGTCTRLHVDALAFDTRALGRVVFGKGRSAAACQRDHEQPAGRKADKLK